MPKVAVIAVSLLGILGLGQGISLSFDSTDPAVFSPAFGHQLDKNHEALALVSEVAVTSKADAIIIWNPISASVSSGCSASGCLASGCLASGCLGSACGGSGCLGSACTGSGCVGSGCLGSGCAGSVCVGSGCFGSVCAGSGCLAASCKRVAEVELEEGMLVASLDPWWQAWDRPAAVNGD